MSEEHRSQLKELELFVNTTGTQQSNSALLPSVCQSTDKSKHWPSMQNSRSLTQLLSTQGDGQSSPPHTWRLLPQSTVWGKKRGADM
jgi:hypothetical protein